MLARLAALVTGRRAAWVVIGGWVLLAAVLAPFAAKLPDETSQAFLLPGGSQSVTVSRILRQRFPGGDLQPVLLVYRRAGGLTPADRARIAADSRRAAHVPQAFTVLTPFGPGPRSGLVSARGDVAVTIVALSPQGVYRVTPSIDALRGIAKSSGALEVHVTGTPAFSSDFDTAVKSADGTLLVATGLLVLGLLLAVYRSLKLALMPLANVALAFVVASGVIDLLARGGLTVDSTSTSLLPVLMFGAGTDYCLLLVARFRSSLRTDPAPRPALAEALPLAAPAMIASALTVTGALVLMLAGVSGIYRALGPVNAIGVVVVLVASLTLLPSLLAVAGPPRGWRKEAPSTSTIWERIGRRIRARSGLYLGGVVLGLAVCALGLGVYRANADILHVFRTQTDATRGAAALLTAFPPGVVGPSTVLIERTNGRLRPDDVTLVSARIRAVPGVAEVTPVSRRSSDGRAVTVSLAFTDDPYGTAALDRMRLIRARLATLPPGLQALTGDGTAARVDLEDAASRDLKVVAPLVLALVFVTLIVLLRALVMPLFLIATVILSFLATCGLVLVLFRYGFDQHAFDPVLPLIVFIFLVALGSDYNIFLMSRVREESAAHGTGEGMLRALAATGPVITSAGLILAGTFCVLAVLPVYDLFEIGVAVGVGVLLDTFVVRTVLVPAGTWVLGEASWWPARVRRAPVLASGDTAFEAAGD
jgi:RND superfamily putative drug exporter